MLRIVMAYIVIAYIGMAYIVMANIAMAYGIVENLEDPEDRFVSYGLHSYG